MRRGMLEEFSPGFVCLWDGDGGVDGWEGGLWIMCYGALRGGLFASTITVNVKVSHIS